MASHNITAKYSGGMSFSSDLDGHTVIIDTDHGSGGNDTGPRPKALMLISLAGCTGVDVVEILNKMRVKFSELSIHVEGELTEVVPKTYHTVTVTYKIKVKSEDETKVQKAVNLSQEKYCGVSAMFKAFCTLKTAVVYL
jgi:putative redox protein